MKQMRMKKSVLGIGLGIALIAGVSYTSMAVAQQVSEPTQTERQALQEENQSQLETQGQSQSQPSVNVEQIKPQAEEQVKSIDREVGLELTAEQIDGLSEAMALFMIGQHEATSDEQLQSMANDYENQVNEILTDEQIKTIVEHSQEQEDKAGTEVQ